MLSVILEYMTQYKSEIKKVKTGISLLSIQYKLNNYKYYNYFVHNISKSFIKNIKFIF